MITPQRRWQPSQMGGADGISLLHHEYYAAQAAPRDRVLQAGHDKYSKDRIDNTPRITFLLPPSCSSITKEKNVIILSMRAMLIWGSKLSCLNVKHSRRCCKHAISSIV